MDRFGSGVSLCCTALWGLNWAYQQAAAIFNLAKPGAKLHTHTHTHTHKQSVNSSSSSDEVQPVEGKCGNEPRRRLCENSLK